MLNDSVRILHIEPNELMEIVRELRAQGLVQGTDFEFKYTPSQYNNDGFEAVSPRKGEFFFRDTKWATFFRLKYGTNN